MIRRDIGGQKYSALLHIEKTIIHSTESVNFNLVCHAIMALLVALRVCALKKINVI